MRYVFDDYTLDTERYELRRAGQPLHLGPQVFAVLVYLVEQRQRVVSREEFFERLWPEQFVSDDALGRCIRAVRRALGETRGTARYIQTVRSRGYRFVAAVTAVEEAEPETSPASVEPGTEPVTPGSAALPFTGEHKQVTLLCGALAHVATLAAGLGPEAMHDLLERLYTLVQEDAQRYDGTLTQWDIAGFTLVFGAPLSQEDHAWRAVLAALDLQQWVHEDASLQGQQSEATVELRLALHSGPVVVAPLGEATPGRYTAVGATAYLASELRQQTPPAALLLSASTYELVQHQVHAEVCGVLDTPALSPPMPVYRVQSPRLEPAARVHARRRPLSRFVGREVELAFLHERFRHVVQGRGQAVGIVGEPGIGKSRLLREFQQSLSTHAVACYAGQCVPYGHHTPSLVVRSLLRQLCALHEADAPAHIMTKVEQCLHTAGLHSTESVGLLVKLLDVDAAPTLLASLSPQAQRVRTQALLRQLYLAHSQQQPLVLAIDDAQWIDATSEEWLATLVTRLAGAAIFVLVAFRSGYTPPWGQQATTTQLALSPLSPNACEAMMRTLLTASPNRETLTQAIMAQAAGNPFYLEELAHTVGNQSGLGTAVVVPGTIQAAVGARLDRLSLEDKRLLQTAAVIGRDIPFDLLQALLDWPEDTLYQHLEALQSAAFLYETQVVPDLVYTFNHALTQEVVYQGLLRPTQQALHQRIAEMLETRFPATIKGRPEVLARHYTEAGQYAVAAAYWLHAGQQATDNSAMVEALRHLTQGLDVVQAVPESPERHQREVELLIARGLVLMISQGPGMPEVGQTYTRAYALCQQLGATPLLLPVLLGLAVYSFQRADFHKMYAFSDQLLHLAEPIGDALALLWSYWGLGVSLFYQGELEPAREHLEQALPLYEPSRHSAQTLCFGGTDPGVVNHYHVALILWLLGYPDQAERKSQQVLDLVAALPHPHSRATALSLASWFYQLRREHVRCQEVAEVAIPLCSAQGFPYWEAASTIMLGSALSHQGQTADGLVHIQQGLSTWKRVEAEIVHPYMLSLLAQAHRLSDAPDTALATVNDALAWVDKYGERWWEAELHRLKGELLLHIESATPPADETPEACFQRALTIARGQRAKLLELRAAMSLGRLWHQQGQRHEARQLLAAVYAWFTEGFDTVDLQEATWLLDALGE